MLVWLVALFPNPQQVPVGREFQTKQSKKGVGVGVRSAEPGLACGLLPPTPGQGAERGAIALERHARTRSGAEGAGAGAGGGAYLPRILLTQPWLTRSCREMSQGRTPWCASSTILCLTTSGRGLPFTNTPPSWLTPPCPAGEREEKHKRPRTAGERGEKGR